MAAAGGAERSPRRPRGAVQPPDPSARIRSPCWDLQLLYTAEGAHRGVARAAEGPSRGRALTAAACQASVGGGGGAKGGAAMAAPRGRAAWPRCTRRRAPPRRAESPHRLRRRRRRTIAAPASWEGVG